MPSGDLLFHLTALGAALVGAALARRLRQPVTILPARRRRHRAVHARDHRRRALERFAMAPDEAERAIREVRRTLE